MDGVISLPVAFAGYYFIPDIPENTRAPYLNKEVSFIDEVDCILLIGGWQERAYGQERMELEGRKPRQPYTKAKFKRILSSWHIYLLSLLYM